MNKFMPYYCLAITVLYAISMIAFYNTNKKALKLVDEAMVQVQVRKDTIDSLKHVVKYQDAELHTWRMFMNGSKMIIVTTEEDHGEFMDRLKRLNQ